MFTCLLMASDSCLPPVKAVPRALPISNTIKGCRVTSHRCTKVPGDQLRRELNKIPG